MDHRIEALIRIESELKDLRDASPSGIKNYINDALADIFKAKSFLIEFEA